jgi:hypothetical protein
LDKLIRVIGFIILIFFIGEGFVIYQSNYGTSSPKNDWDFSLGSAVAKPSIPLEKAKQGLNVNPPPSIIMPKILPKPITIPISNPVTSLKEIKVYAPEAVAEESPILGEKLAKEIEKEFSPRKLGAFPTTVHEKIIKIPEKKVTKKAKVKEKQEKKKIAGEIMREQAPKEEEADVLVSIVYGQGKLIIKLPPLDPREKERLVKELEKWADIIGRQGQLIEIEKRAQ